MRLRAQSFASGAGDRYGSNRLLHRTLADELARDLNRWSECFGGSPTARLLGSLRANRTDEAIHGGGPASEDVERHALARLLRRSSPWW